MDVSASVDLAVAAERVFVEVEDLFNYPDWLDMVAGADPAVAHGDDPGPAWVVDLLARFGPLSKRKRVRMVRTVHRSPEEVRFERMEHDGREHPAWVLSAGLAPSGTTTRLTMRLQYSGPRSLPMVERAVREEIRRAGRRLADQLR